MPAAFALAAAVATLYGPGKAAPVLGVKLMGFSFALVAVAGTAFPSGAVSVVCGSSVPARLQVEEPADLKHFAVLNCDVAYENVHA